MKTPNDQSPEPLARQIVNDLASNGPEILQRDFFNSLCAAFTPEEVQLQLLHSGLEMLVVEDVSKRHLFVTGKL